MKEIVLATSNKGKIAELEELLAPVTCIPQASLGISSVKETGLTFVENALIKARHASIETGKPALADDSGLVVYALNGEPGIHSSRYSGNAANDQNNIEKLLHHLKGVPDEQRGAFFYCAIVLVRHATDPTPLIATGQLNGFITCQQAGTDGFGYDPVFYIPSQEATAAQLSTRIKNTISHRAQALKSLLQRMHS